MLKRKRRTNSQSRLTKLTALLKEIKSNPESFRDSPLAVAMQSNATLLAYSDESLGLRGMSINTAKHVAPLVLNGGYGEFEALRRGAKAALLNSSSGRTNAPAAEGSSSDAITILMQDLFQLSLLFNRSLQQARRYVETTGDPALRALCSREQVQLLAGLTLIRSKIPLDTVSK